MNKKLGDSKSLKESIAYILKCVDLIDKIKDIVNTENFDSKDAMSMIFEIKRLVGESE